MLNKVKVNISIRNVILKNFLTSNRPLKGKIFSFVLLIMYLFFFYLMLRIVLQYIPYKTDVAFLMIKQDVIEIPFYKIAFFTHVYTAIFVLIAGLTQFSKSIRKNFPKLHRVSGWIYVSVIILFAGPSGFYMGIYSNGGLISHLAFCILALLWMYFTCKALIEAVNHRYNLHRKFMLRSFALTLSAITLRAWKYIIVYFFEPRPMDAYQIVAWLGWVPNLILIEFIILNFPKTFRKSNHRNENNIKTVSANGVA